MVKISIIMPVYNCAEYLHDSIGSLCKQTLTEWELLCIDDGSTDDSQKILESYCDKDRRIKVFSQKNQGAGPARNLGLQMAVGEFIAFLDADDMYGDADALQCMYETCITKQVKACGAKMSKLQKEDILQCEMIPGIYNQIKNQTIFSYRDFQFDYGYYCFIFNRQSIVEKDFAFPPYRRFQDPPFLVRLLTEIEKFAFVDKNFYIYRVPNTFMRFDGKKVYDLLCGLFDNLQFALEYDLEILFEKTRKRLEYEYADLICTHVSSDNFSVLEKLLECNHLVQKKYGQNYLLRPLQRMIQKIEIAEKQEVEHFLYNINTAEEIYIYGAGKLTEDFLEYLDKNGLIKRVKAVLVTDIKNNLTEINGIKVQAIEAYQYKEGDFIAITASGIYEEEIIKCLQEKKVLHYMSFKSRILYK